MDRFFRRPFNAFGETRLALRLDSPRRLQQTSDMKRIGMFLLGLYLIVDSLLGFGLNIGAAIFLLYLIGLIAGALIVFSAAAKSG